MNRFLFLLPAACLAAAGHAANLGENVDGLLAAARAGNPELALMRAEAEAARQRVQPAGALADPVLRVEVMDASTLRSGETRYTLMQPLPAWGKRELRREVAVADVRQAEARSTATWAELAMRVKTTYARYYFAAANERLTREILELMARVEQVAQVRYAGGLAPQQDAIRAQLERTTMQGELIMLQAERHHQQSRLNALLARDPTAPLADPLALPPLPSRLDTQALAQRARANNPLLAAEQARLAAAERSRELAQRNRYPDVTVGVQPTQMGSRITSWGVMVELNLPLQQASRRSQEAEADAMVGAARARIDNTSNQLFGELHETVLALDVARLTAQLAATQALPQSELSLRSALAAYENGKVEFTALLEAQRQIRKVRQDQLKAEVEARMRLAEIERIVGEDL